ncbi:MAG: hypothetical protein HYT89_01605 [Candidatus Omnitrophica bacterium]|nr:hypothetical protein [Candidatus Omnitrophota bacterium]
MFLNEIKTELKNIPAAEKDLRKFGWTLGVVCGVLGGWWAWRQKGFAFYALGVSVFFLLFGWLAPRALKPVQRVWMGLALAVGGVMTRVLLAAVFYLVITPIAALLKAFGKKFLDTTFRENPESSWKPHEPRDHDSYERPF